MHYQSRSAFRERDHRISLMPMERPAGEPPIWLGTALILAVGIVGAMCLYALFGGFK